MPAFFPHARGTVVRVDGPWGQATPFQLSLGSIILKRAIITQVGIQQEGNFQFLHTLSDSIFVYIFGDRISELMVSGVAFGATCDGGHGLDETLDIYDANKLSVRGRPLTISYGSRAFRGFLTGNRQDLADPETTLGQFSYRFHSFPTRAVR